ncbi:MAG: hypothetical protein OCC45_07505 [Desulfotalea sp.]
MNFYRNLFAILCFAFFIVAISTSLMFAYLAAMFCAMISRTAEKKGWSDPF